MGARPLKFGATVTAAIVTVSLLAAPGYAAQGVGRVTAWGYNADGLLGNGSTTNSTVPVNTVGALAGKTVTGHQRGFAPRLCGGRRPGLLLGVEHEGTTREQFDL